MADEQKTPPKNKRALPDQVARLEAQVADLAAQVRELQHDLVAGTELLGAILGEPFRSQAREIVSTRQTAAVKEG